MQRIKNLPTLAQLALISLTATTINVSLCLWAVSAQDLIKPQTQPQCTQYCPIGDSGQPAEPIGR